MKTWLIFFLLLPALVLTAAESPTVLFSDPFQDHLSDGWTWLRENPKAWRIGDHALEIHLEPGNMWGGDNDAKNVLIRPLPKIEKGSLLIQATVENKPTSQYEQVDLVCYFDDSNMVKIGLELVDEQLSLVMGREENDKTRTLAIIPLDSTKVHLQLTVEGTNIKGAFRTSDTSDWRLAGVCDLPGKGDPKISLQAYQGAENVEHWANVSNFQILQTQD